MLKRHYFPSRQAYAPRIWPMLLVCVVIDSIILGVLQLQGYWFIIPAPIVAVVVVQGRWWIWKRRHPRRSVEQWLKAQRDNAMWN